MGTGRAARQFFETLRNRRTSCIEAARGPKIFLLPAREGLQHRGRHPVAHPPLRFPRFPNPAQNPALGPVYFIYRERQRPRQHRLAAPPDGCRSMSERRRRKEYETPAVERADNHSDTDSDSVDSESDHEGRCRSFCASNPCQYSVLCALCSAVAAGRTCHVSATARCVLRTKPGIVIFCHVDPIWSSQPPPTQQVPRQMVDSVAGELGKRWTDSRLISSTSLWPPCS